MKRERKDSHQRSPPAASGSLLCPPPRDRAGDWPAQPVSRARTWRVLGKSPTQTYRAGLPGAWPRGGGLRTLAARLRTTAAAVAGVRGVDAMAGPAWISKVSAGQARMWLAGVLGAGRGLARGPRWGGDGARLTGNSQGAGPGRPCAWLGGPQAVCRQPRSRKVAPGAGTASRSRRGAPVLFPVRPQCHRRHLSRPEPRPRAEPGKVTGAAGQAPPSSRLFPKLRPCSLLIALRVRLSTTRAFPRSLLPPRQGNLPSHRHVRWA